MKQLWLMGLAALFLGACSSVPDELEVVDEASLVSYKNALEQPEQYIGQPARWGGMIAAVRNTDAGTEIEVVHLELQGWGRPVPSDQSDGRFRAKLAGFVDPMVYKEGRYITFTGTIAAAETGMIDEYNYLFPVLNASGKYLWPIQKEKTQVEVDYSSLWYRHYYFSRPHYPGPVIIRNTQGASEGGSGQSDKGNN
ncbi:Slp family lipoprotein [Pseudidiomarina sp. WS423]|uniref:Slp family lipoprotein n=1 Tax=Pseudidiomarina sp. WS423 TaxID=3425124 RepID=UPI003D6FBDB7